MPAEEMKQYLDSLELYTTINGTLLEITVPTFRTDINIKEDIAEEIVRIYGYDKLPSTIISSVSEKGENRKAAYGRYGIKYMLASGLSQSISYAFISPKAFDKINLPEDSELRNTVKIKNPLGEDYSVMRTTTIPSIMESLGRNYARNNEVARLFEIGRVYIPLKDDSLLPEERNILTAGMYGECDYFDLKVL